MAKSKTMQKFRTDQYVAPKASELRWVFIDQPGKEGPKGDNGEPGKFRLVADLVAKTDSDGCKALMKFIDDFLKENKPKGMKVKSRGYYVIQEKTGGLDEDGVSIMRDTDETSFSFWTGTHWADGKPVVVDIYNSKGKKVSLGGKKIGNGSQGSISGSIDVYSHSGACGVSLYLNAIQLTKFEEYTTDAGFEAMDEDDDAFDGVENDFEGTVAEEAEVNTAAKPRL
jgi:hypothetical protein